MKRGFRSNGRSVQGLINWPHPMKGGTVQDHMPEIWRRERLGLEIVNARTSSTKSEDGQGNDVRNVPLALQFC